MHKPKIYVNGFGYMCPLKDYEQIIWMWEQSLKKKNQSVITRFYLNMKLTLRGELLKIQAFELLHHIESKVTCEQEKRSAAYKLKVKRQSEIELRQWKRRLDKSKMMTELLKMITPN
jgi:hypothetical protein